MAKDPITDLICITSGLLGAAVYKVFGWAPAFAETIAIKIKGPLLFLGLTAEDLHASVMTIIFSGLAWATKRILDKIFIKKEGKAVK